MICFTVIEQLFVGAANGKIVAHMVDTGALSLRKAQDILGSIIFLNGQKGHGGFSKVPGFYALVWDNNSALEKDRQLLPKGLRKAFFCGNADLFQGVWLIYRMKQHILNGCFFSAFWQLPFVRTGAEHGCGADAAPGSDDQ